MIVRVGERVTQEQATKLDSIFESRGIERFFMGVGVLGLVLVLFYFPYRFARKNIRKFSPSNKDILLLTLMTIGNFVVLKIAFIVSTAMGSLLPFIDTAVYYYFFPFAASAIIVRIILNSEVALVYCAVCAPLLGIMFNSSLQVVIYALLGGIVGAHGVRQCKERNAIYVAGLKVSVVNVAMAISFQFFSDSAFTIQTAYCVVFAGLGGIFNAVCVTGTIPLIEALFHYTTDIKLLELANLNTPILRELMVRLPAPIITVSLSEILWRPGPKRSMPTLFWPGLQPITMMWQDQQAPLLHRKCRRRRKQARQAFSEHERSHTHFPC